jgi:SMC interacting uncharacterized protein involved in chromosome segregation
MAQLATFQAAPREYTPEEIFLSVGYKKKQAEKEMLECELAKIDVEIEELEQSFRKDYEFVQESNQLLATAHQQFKVLSDRIQKEPWV